MPLPAAALLAALGTAARLGGRIALRTGAKLFRGTARKVPASKRTYLMSGGKLRKNKLFARRTNVAKIPTIKRSLKRAGMQMKRLGPEIKRTALFTSKIAGPHIKNPLGGNKIKGKSFHHIFNRPQFGKTNFIENYKRYPGATTMKRESAYNLLNKRKTRSKIYKKLGIRAGYVAGMGYYLGDD